MSSDGVADVCDSDDASLFSMQIGVCGRTGSGKSSLALSLLRIIPTDGSVKLVRRPSTGKSQAGLTSLFARAGRRRRQLDQPVFAPSGNHERPAGSVSATSHPSCTAQLLIAL